MLWIWVLFVGCLFCGCLCVFVDFVILGLGDGGFGVMVGFALCVVVVVFRLGFDYTCLD